MAALKAKLAKAAKSRHWFTRQTSKKEMALMHDERINKASFITLPKDTIEAIEPEFALEKDSPKLNDVQIKLDFSTIEK